MTTTLLYAPAAEHTRQHHPESKRRVAGLLPFFEDHGVLGDLSQIEAESATLEQLLQVHSADLLDRIRQASESRQRQLDSDTYVTAQSYELARLAAGGCCLAVDRIAAGEARNGLAVVRPPGHHAGRNQVGGFCLINNIAVAARHAQVQHGLVRILIVDFDVHHGNGTQEIFYGDGTVLFVSAHLFHPFFYPGTGGLEETGRGSGRGLTINIPFPPGVGDAAYEQVFREVIVPKAREFAPQLILVSAGFDAHWNDPLARANVSLPGFFRICQILLALAGELCGGRILFVLEGGYHLPALRCGLLNTANALLGRDEMLDPLGPGPQHEAPVTNLLRALRRQHLLN